ncbi:MAG TPA: nucleoside monophosphate kinase, partial [Mycobacteriales bacterium]|nr:nucleoside monophosphate kinase [Mycobacteriales bacterium]
VPDEVVLDMVREAFVAARGGGGYVLDGMPRTMPQARACYAIAAELGMTAEVVLHLRIEDAELVRRLLARAAEQGRSDDTEEVIRRRIEVYDEVTRPILAWYRERAILVSVDAEQPVEEVGADILAALTRLGLAPDPDHRSPRPVLDLTGLDAAFGAATRPGTL